MKLFELSVDEQLLADLKDYNIFQARSGMRLGTDYRYINRYRLGDQIKFDRYTTIEEYVTFADGQHWFSSGSFSSLASCLPIGSTTGRYCSIATGFKPMGFRHPIEAVCMNSATFNFSRENIASYFAQYERENGPVTKPLYLRHNHKINPFTLDMMFGLAQM